MAKEIKLGSILQKYNYLDVVLLFVVSRVVFLLVMILSGNSLDFIYSSFDARHYLEIAKHGYTSNDITAFFPAFPLVIRCFTTYGAILINNICFVASILILKKLNCTSWMMLTFVLGPAGFFSMLLYTESMFIFFTLAAFYLWVNHKNPLLIGFIIGLSVFTRSTGSTLFFAVFIGMCIQWYRKEIKFKDIVITYIPATLIAVLYPIYLQIEFGNWKNFVDCQFENWYRLTSSIPKTFVVCLKMIFTDTYEYRSDVYKPLEKANELLSVILLLVFVTLIIIAVKKMITARKINIGVIVMIAYVVFTLFAVNSTIKDPNLDSPTVSYYRYYYSVFPLYLMISNLKPSIQRIFALITISITFSCSYIFCLNSFFY